MDVSLIKITHIKAHFKVDKEQLFANKNCLCNTIRNKPHKNICVFDCRKLSEGKPYVFIIFSSGHVNVVGLRKEKDISLAVSFFCLLNFLQPKHIIEPVVIDNITGTGHLESHLNLKAFFYYCKRGKNYKFPRVTYNPSIIGVLYLKYYKGGRINIGRSGKFSVVGVTTRHELKCIHQDMVVFMTNYMRTVKEGLLCANNAQWN